MQANEGGSTLPNSMCTNHGLMSRGSTKKKLSEEVKKVKEEDDDDVNGNLVRVSVAMERRA